MTDTYFDGSVRTQYLDPVSYVPNGRCAFDLDGDKLAYLSNMRILGLGVHPPPPLFIVGVWVLWLLLKILD